MPPPLRGVRAVLFDLDETLVPDRATTVAALERVVATLRDREYFLVPQVTQALLNHARHIWRGSPHYGYFHRIGVSTWEALWAPLPDRPGPMPEAHQWVLQAYRPAVWHGLADALEMTDPDLPAQLEAAFLAERRAAGSPPFLDAAPALERLAARYALGLVTNGLACLQREKLAASGLGGFFRAVVVSAELGEGKPSPAPFRAALAALGVPPEAAIMVGDSLERDVQGARNAGLRAVWVNRSGAARSAGPLSDYDLADLGGLMELLA